MAIREMMVMITTMITVDSDLSFSFYSSRHNTEKKNVVNVTISDDRKKYRVGVCRPGF